MWLRFNKMHGLGNDFMVVDLITQNVQLNEETIRKLADRNFGIGFDQLLLVETPTQPDVDFKYRIFNSDGGEVENCGNGARCFARFVYEQKLTGRRTIRVETAVGVMDLELTDNKDVVVDMGAPILEPALIPFEADQQANEYQLNVKGHDVVTLGAVSMGNPHAVVLVDNVSTAPVETLGPLLESHPRFPQRVNVGFMEIVDRRHVKLRVFERGVGETLACGTGACAAVVSGHLRGLLEDEVQVDLPGGSLQIDWDGEGSVIMTGPTTNVFEGRIHI